MTHGTGKVERDMQPGRHRSEVAPGGRPRQRVQAQSGLRQRGLSGVLRHPSGERDALCGRTIELELFHRPRAAHDVPAVPAIAGIEAQDVAAPARHQGIDLRCRLVRADDFDQMNGFKQHRLTLRQAFGNADATRSAESHVG